MKQSLRLSVSPAKGDSFERTFEGESIIIGRASTADLSLPDRFLSRQHTRIYKEGACFVVEDLGSRNGTLLNGVQISQPTPLKAGDEVRLSGNTLTLLAKGQAIPTAETSEPGMQTIFREVSTLGPTKEPKEKGEEELRRYAERLRLVNEIHHALASSVSLEELLELILARIFDHLRPEQGSLYLLQEDGSMKVAARRDLPGSEGEQVLSQSLVREVIGKGVGALVLDARADERFAAAQSILTSGVRSLLAAPLLGPDKALGIIVLGSRVHVKKFTEDDLDLLGSLASVAALRIHNVALAEEAAERRRLEKELALARRIQEGLLPKTLPRFPGYELFGTNTPSRGVSGDFYTVVACEDGSCVVVLADVSGKGMAASLLTASLEALTAGPIEVGRSPEDICARVSRRLFQRTPPEKYATGFILQLEPSSGKLRYCNAGHNQAILLRRGGSIELLEATGVPIGLVAGAPYTGADTHLSEGDLLVLYTDGITEAADPDEEEFGLERLEDVCRTVSSEDLPTISAEIDKVLTEFARGEPFADDRTVVLLRRKSI